MTDRIEAAAPPAEEKPAASTALEGQVDIVAWPGYEGATGWADTTMLHAQAKHPNCAYKWME